MMELITILLIFIALLLLIILGFHVAFVICALGIVFGYFVWGSGVFNIAAKAVVSTVSNPILAAIPLFIFMGHVLERTQIAEEAFDTLYCVLGPLRGGLAVSTILISTLFAATTGIIGAAVTSMALIALPAMIKKGYDKALAAGTVCAGGTLGILIPPSIMLIVYGNSAGISVAKMFIGAILPGLLLSTLYCVYVLILSYLRPNVAPAIPPEERRKYTSKQLIMRFLRSFVPFICIILAVLGGIFFGIVSPTEAGALGSAAALILALAHRKLNLAILKDAMVRSAAVTAMVVYIMMGATILSRAFMSGGYGAVLADYIIGAGSFWVSFAIMFGIIFILGMLLDWVATIMLLVPIIQVVLVQHYGMDPLLIGELVCIFLQTSFLTPPFAYAIFYLSGVAQDVTVKDVYKGVVPFVILQIIGFAICVFFPQLILWPINLMRV